MSSYAQYTATGAATVTVPCPYISSTHIKVTVNGVLFVMGAHYDLLTSATITFRPAFIPVAGALVDVWRETPSSPLVSYTNGSVLTADDLNRATLQALYGVEELRDRYERLLNGGLARVTNGTVVSSSETIDALVQEVLSNALLVDVAALQTDIDAAGETLLDQSVTLAAVQAQVDALGVIDGTGIGALVTAEQAARVAADTAMASDLLLLGAHNGANTAFELNLGTVNVSSTESLATRLTALNATDASNTASIASEAVTRANGDGAIAVLVSNLTSTVGGHTTSLSTNLSSINGIQAKYSVKIDNNGNITGFDLISEPNVKGAPLSKFRIVADRFEVWNGTAAVAPFYVDGGIVYMQNIKVQTAQIESLTVGKLVDGGDSPFAPKAWARFYGKSTGAYLTRAKNIASIVRIAEGRFEFTFTSPVPNAYHIPQPTGSNTADGSSPLMAAPYAMTTTGFRVSFKSAGGNYRDPVMASVIVFGADTADTLPPSAYDPVNDPAVGSGGWSRASGGFGSAIP